MIGHGLPMRRHRAGVFLRSARTPLTAMAVVALTGAMASAQQGRSSDDATRRESRLKILTLARQSAASIPAGEVRDKAFETIASLQAEEGHASALETLTAIGGEWKQMEGFGVRV